MKKYVTRIGYEKKKSYSSKRGKKEKKKDELKQEKLNEERRKKKKQKNKDIAARFGGTSRLRNDGFPHFMFQRKDIES